MFGDIYALPLTSAGTIPNAAPNISEPAEDRRFRTLPDQAGPRSLVAWVDGTGTLTAEIWIYTGRGWLAVDSIDVAAGVLSGELPVPNDAVLFARIVASTASGTLFLGSRLTTPSAVSTLPLPGGAATEAKQNVGNVSLASLDSKSPALVAGRVPVDGSGVTQPVSAASLPLPAGASTSALQTTGNTFLGSIASNFPEIQDGLLPAVVTQGTAAAVAGAWPVIPTDGSGGHITPAGDVASRAPFARVTDGTNTTAVKAASTAPVATDPAAVVALSPNTPQLPATLGPKAPASSFSTVPFVGSALTTPAAFSVTTSAQLGSNSFPDGFTLQAPSTNTASIYLAGASAATVGKGIELAPGDAVTLQLSNTNAVWAVAASGTQALMASGVTS